MKSLNLDILFARGHIKTFIFFVAVVSAVSSLCAPYFQKEFINCLYQKNNNYSEYLHHEYFLVFISILFSLFAQALFYFNKYLCFNEAIKVNKDLSQKIYLKTLNLTHKSKEKLTVGHILSIQTADVTAACEWVKEVFPIFASYIFPILLAPFAVYTIAKITIIPTFCAIFFILTINFIISLKQRVLLACLKNSQLKESVW